MTEYRAPVADMMLALDTAADLEGVLGAGAYGDVDRGLVAAMLEEAGRLAGDVIGPLNRVADEKGAHLENGAVRTPPGFADAYRQYVDGGWNAVAFDPDYGGQGLPFALSIPLQEMWNAACMSFGLCTVLNVGAAEALSAHGTTDQKERYLSKLISGEWTGTMNLTEPQAGSDVGALKTRAVPQADGSYLITGTKIFITYGEHDMTDNIVHLVLARLPDAPAGTKGISLFLVPKFMVGDDGAVGARNDVKCVGLEEKLGVHGSPTCVMSYGDDGGAVGYLVGEENRGMAHMFTMMNNARLNVGVQGVAIAERAYQHALDYARERRQGRVIGKGAGEEPDPIIAHPDVRRMLMTMRALTQAARAICYANAGAIDLARVADSDEVRKAAQARCDLLTPISKAFSTDIGVEVASIGVQIHGGMGFVEETGAAQHYRDARITPIYEGTNGIQAIDLVTRKLPSAGGEPARALIEEIRQNAATLKASNNDALQSIGRALDEAATPFEETTEWLIERFREAPRDCLAGATPYLRMAGLVAGAHTLAQGAATSARRIDGGSGDTGVCKAKIDTARYFAEQLLPGAAALKPAVTAGADGLFAVDEDGLGT